jgi:hypothetical protein
MGLRAEEEGMLKRLSERLISLSKGWVVFLALAVFLLFTALVLPGQAADSKARTGGAPQPDTSFIYSADDLYRMTEAFGPTGRQAYVQARFTFDVVWPLVYAFFLITAISWLAGRAFQPASRWRLLNLVPVTAIILDYLENVAAVIVVARYPLQTPVIDLLAPSFTFLKWLFVSGSFVVLLAVATAAVWQRIARRFVRTA